MQGGASTLVAEGSTALFFGADKTDQATLELGGMARARNAPTAPRNSAVQGRAFCHKGLETLFGRQLGRFRDTAKKCGLRDVVDNFGYLWVGEMLPQRGDIGIGDYLWRGD